MKKLFAFLILLTMMLTLFSGCKEVRDPDLIYKVPLSEEMKEEINDVIKVNLDYVNYYEGSSYYGMINDCVIIRDSTYILAAPGGNPRVRCCICAEDSFKRKCGKVLNLSFIPLRLHIFCGNI